MSQLIFPAVTIPAATGGFDWKLPIKITPQYKTLVQTPSNNRGELRVSLTQYPIFLFEMEIPYIFGDPDLVNDGFQQLLGFYGAMQGSADDWLFDWLGNNAVTAPEVIGVGDGVSTTAVLTHGIGGMVELIQNPKSVPTVYVGGAALSPSQFSIDAYGNVTFVTPPPLNDTVAWLGSWYTRCRFLDDQLQDLQMIRGGGSSSLWNLKSLKFKSVLL